MKLFAIARQEPFYVWFHTDADELTNAGGGDEKDNELVGFPPGGQNIRICKINQFKWK